MMTQREGTLTGRLGLLSRAIVFLWVVLIGRFFMVAVLQHQYFSAAAARQQVGSEELIPQRGEVLSAEDERVATNIIQYSVEVVPRNIKNKEEFASLLAPEIGMATSELLTLINNDLPYLPPVKKGLSEEEGKRLLKLNLVGLIVRQESVRFYPEGSLAAHLVGFVNAEGRGQYGLEGFYDEVLRGFRGSVLYEKDREGRAIELTTPAAPVRDGTTLLTSLDRNLQFMVEEILQNAVKKFNADGGSVVVMKAGTGEILAMASVPTFDPGNFKEVGDNHTLFLNPATQLTWEPGSVIKPLAMAAAVEEGVVSPETTETFGSSVVVDGWTINTAQNKPFGRETMTQVLENSDNVAMVWVADKLGNERYFDYLKNFGFDDKTEVDLQGEADSKLHPLKEWRSINRATISFGQGIAITPLQLTTAYAALANGGKLLWPHLVTGFRRPDGAEETVEPKVVREVVSAETAKKLTDMLVSVVENGHGKRAKVAGYKIAGKTGTAQVPSASGGYEEDKHVGSFCGYAPAEAPLFAMCVKLDTPRNVDWAEASAAPVFGEVMGWMLAHYGIPPNK